MEKSKKDRIKALMSKLSELSDEQKEILVKKLGITNPEGHILSRRNQILLYMQNKEISFSVVAGFKQWLKYGRCVNKGQKGFLISVPSSKNLKEENLEDVEKESQDIFFLWKTVFDISQTYKISKEQAA